MQGKLPKVCLTPSEIIKAFFRDPSIPPSSEYYSPLFSLRRDINICLNPNNGNQNIAIWPATLLMLIGIDLMASCYSVAGLEGDRFKEFCNDFLHINNPLDQTALWKFRCSLAHEYGLTGRNFKDVILFNIAVTYEPSDAEFIEKDGPAYDYKISAYILRNKFNGSINEFQDYVNTKQNCVGSTFMNKAQEKGLHTWRMGYSSSGSTRCEVEIVEEQASTKLLSPKGDRFEGRMKFA